MREWLSGRASPCQGEGREFESRLALYVRKTTVCAVVFLLILVQKAWFPMNIILCALNAKFIHSSLAVHELYANLDHLQAHVQIREYTINHTADFILAELFAAKPDVVCFSCYIWNMKMIRQIAEDLKTVLPGLRIVLGGPEASYDYEELLAFADYIVYGEGEATFRELVQFFVQPQAPLESVKGIAFLRDGSVYDTGSRPVLPLDDLRFAYENGFDNFQNRILYYETARGCPFRCQYCLSSAGDGVRFLSQARVERELSIFLQAKVRQVKLVDRTFNCNKAHAMHIWQYLIRHDNGITNFHFEIAGDLLDDEMLTLLRAARPGLFQFEIGVQSTNRETLDAIQRRTDLSRLFTQIDALRQNGNIHLHLDLIAGLPGEDFTSFARSFNAVYKAGPHQLQLGFLKLLKGSGLRRDTSRFGIAYRHYPPYEVLYTKELPFGDMLALKQIEEMVELYYNSHKFIAALPYVVPLADSPFTFYQRLASYWYSHGYHQAQYPKIKLYEILYQFCLAEGLGQDAPLRDLLRFDLLLCDPAKNIPPWLMEPQEDTSAARDFFRDEGRLRRLLPGYNGFSARQISRMCTLQSFDYDMGQWLPSGSEGGVPPRRKVYLLFDYRDKLSGPELSSFHARYTDVTKECYPYEDKRKS